MACILWERATDAGAAAKRPVRLQLQWTTMERAKMSTTLLLALALTGMLALSHLSNAEASSVVVRSAAELYVAFADSAVERIALHADVELSSWASLPQLRLNRSLILHGNGATQ